ncbi:MAG: lytic transglycosylase domain-containing protein [Deltaproteobacteria bacterium]|nr:lytic transglycosylase domain-containing protein [Deltaproteobacteria bacterium]
MRRWKQQVLGAAAGGLAIALGVIVLVNVAVRELGGGEPHLLSPFFFEEKVGALASLGRHLALHPFRSCHPRPRAILDREARRAGLPVELVQAVAEAESEHRPHRISSAGAMGLMQLMPDTVARFEVADPFDPEDSARGGTRFLAVLWRRYDGDRARVVAAYHAGPGAVPRRGAMALSSETRAYVLRVLSGG